MGLSMKRIQNILTIFIATILILTDVLTPVNYSVWDEIFFSNQNTEFWTTESSNKDNSQEIANDSELTPSESFDNSEDSHIKSDDFSITEAPVEENISSKLQEEIAEHFESSTWNVTEEQAEWILQEENQVSDQENNREENTNNETNNEESNEANFDKKTDEGTKEDTDDETSEWNEAIQNIDDNNVEGENKDEDKSEDESEDENFDQDWEENFEDTPVLLRSVTLSTPSLRSVAPLGNTLQNANDFSDFEEIVYTWILDDAEVSYTIMDRNLWATSNNVNDSSSDGYYYQYGNNHGFERSDYINSAGTFKALGPFTTSILSWVTKPYYSEIFSKIKGDRSVESPLALRWGEDDAPENDYDSANPRIERQGPCPTGRHVPSMEEMYLLLRLFFSNNGIEFQKKWKAISYPERVGKEGAAEITLTQGQYDLFLSTFKIRLAWRIDHNTDNRYIGTTRPQSFWWVSTKWDTMNGWNLQTNNNSARGIYLNLWWWADYHTWALPMRCLKDETDLKVIRINDDGTILETDEHLDFGIMPEYNGSTPTKAPDENYIYEFSWWNYPIWKLKRNRVFTATFSKQERSGYIVTFSGTDLAPVTVIEEQKVEKPGDPTRDDAIFLGWYADPEFNQIFDFSSPIMQDTIIYAKWQEDDNSYTAIKARSFPLTYHFGDSLTFNKDKLINTDLHLFTTGNLLQDFVISMGIDQFSFQGVAEQATVFSLMDERGEPYPGILTRKQNERSKLEFVVNTATQNKVGFYTFQTGFISFARFNQSIYSWDESNSKVVTGIAWTPSFDYPLVIWWSLDENKDPWRLMKGTLSNVKVKVRYDSMKPFQFPEPTQSWWDFIGRYKDANFTTPATVTNIASGDILYPKWEPITYVRYTFNAWSGVFSDGTEEKSDSYKVRNTFPTIEEPTLSGYHFIGRSEDKINLINENTVTHGDKTFYALYEAQGTPYTVEHYQEDLNGTFTLKDTETKSGTTDTFTNATAKSYPWFSLSGEIEQKRIAWDESTIVQIYYKRNEYTITFNTDGGSPINSITAKYWSLLTSPNVPTKYGYTFDGWTPAFPSEMPVDGATLQAKRKANRVHITFDKKGGTGGTDEFWFTYGISRYYADPSLSQRIMDIIPPTRTWYLFKEYKSESERYVAYDDNGNYIAFADDLSTDLGEDITLTAIWEIQKIHITLDPQGGTGGTSDFYFSFNEKKYYSDENLTQEISKVIKPQKTGYLFQDYFSESIGERFVSYEKDGTRVELDSPNEDTYYRISKNTTLKARRTPKKIHITLDKQGGTGGTNEFWYQYHTPTFYADENLSQILTGVIRPQRTGYTFKNYRTEQERYVAYEDQGTMIEFADDLHFDLYQDTILKATWEANTYTLQFSAWEGTGSMEDQVFTRDIRQTLRKNTFTKPWYHFKYRITSDQRTFLDQMSLVNIIDSWTILLTAVWEKDQTNNQVKPLSSWKGSSGGRRLIKDNCPNGDFSDSYYDKKCSNNTKEEKSDQTHGSAEDIYEWAKEVGLTSMDSIENFQWNRFLTRAEIAKIVSLYLTKILGRKEVANDKCSMFDDIQDIHSDLHEYIISACNLGIMGRTSDWNDVKKSFHPYYRVTKAEVVTIISRVFWGHTYKNIGEEKRYERHLHHLMDLWVVDNANYLQDSFTRGNFYSIFRELYLMKI